MAGHEVPILHGLATLGMSVRHILKQYADNDSKLFKSLKVSYVMFYFSFIQNLNNIDANHIAIHHPVELKNIFSLSYLNCLPYFNFI